MPTRRYYHKQILRLDFSKLGDAFTDSVKTTLTALLNEVFVTLFADNQPYISAVTPGECGIPLTYSMTCSDTVAPAPKSIFIIEDSQLDLGLLIAVERNLNRILQIIADYLAWNDERPTQPDCSAHGKREKKPYHQRYYLLYGGNTLNEHLDLAGTRSFLQSMGFDGGELRQARQGRRYAAAMLTDGDPSAARCSYCGSEISGVEYYRMPDGRLRCTTCSNSVVKSPAAVQEILDRVLSNLDSFFGANISVPIAIELLEQRKLKKKIQCPLSQIDDQSILILGAAVNRKQQDSILLENGAPRISLIATFAHELTHIWQYTHRDAVEGFRKFAGSKRLRIYEGMAKWAEIQYLYLVGENAAAQREEAFTRQRQDEYGIGFRIYENTYPLVREAMTCTNTPFTPGRYPLE